MLQFKQSDTAAILILTLTENVSINDPYFLFVFTHILTKNKVKFIKFAGADESGFTGRYNQFTINAVTVFEDQPIGQWNYKVSQQASAVNTDESLTGAVLEYGKLILDRETEFEFAKYNETTSFKTYNG